MRKPNSIELREDLSCATCEYAELCNWNKGLRDKENWICEHYCNIPKGYIWDNASLRKVKK